MSVVTPSADAAPANDAPAAAKLARDQHAPLAIIGSYQLVGEELRVTGQMIESINGEHIAAIKATGSLRDLFGIEDIIGSQVRRDLQVILQPEMASSDPRSSGAGDPFGVESTGPVQRQTPRGSYNGSDLQRSLGDDEWNPQPGSYAEDRRNRYRYDYPPPTYYPPYSYYDWCGYNYYTPWRPPLIGHPVVPAGPGPTRTDFPQNNYNTVPGQMGRTSSNNNFNTTPGQMNRSSGNTNFNNHPGQMGRTSGGNAIQSSPGQIGRTSSGSSSQVGPSGQSGRTGSSSGSVSRSSGSSSSGNASRSAVSGSSGNASRSTGSSSGNASRSTGSSSGNASQR